MNWKDYEKEINEYFRSQFPNAEISHNVFLKGRYSQVNRQVDILIEDYVAGNRIRIVIDGKYFSQKIDVKDVEMFIGMLSDCEANKGLLITQEGYSEAAIKRAYHDPIDIELDIYNFKDLHDFQGFLALPFSDGHGVILNAPFGWIIDNTVRAGALATSYQRGLTLESAQKSNEWLYINIKNKDDKIKSLDDFIKLQNDAMIEHFPEAKILTLSTIRRNDAVVKLRSININTYPTVEYTGFVEFEDFIFFCVLFTPELVRKRNIRKLEGILREVLNFDVIVKSFNWDIENGRRGSLMFLDVPYYQEKINDMEYLSLTVAKDYLNERPEFISIKITNNTLKQTGISISFAKLTQSETDDDEIEMENDVYLIDFENCNEECCTARIKRGFLLSENMVQIDVFKKLMDFDQIYFYFDYSDGSNKSVAVPLFSFKEQYKLLDESSH